MIPFDMRLPRTTGSGLGLDPRKEAPDTAAAFGDVLIAETRRDKTVPTGSDDPGQVARAEPDAPEVLEGDAPQVEPEKGPRPSATLEGEFGTAHEAGARVLDGSGRISAESSTSPLEALTPSGGGHDGARQEAPGKGLRSTAADKVVRPDKGASKPVITGSIGGIVISDDQRADAAHAPPLRSSGDHAVIGQSAAVPQTVPAPGLGKAAAVETRRHELSRETIKLPDRVGISDPDASSKAPVRSQMAVAVMHAGMSGNAVPLWIAEPAHGRLAMTGNVGGVTAEETLSPLVDGPALTAPDRAGPSGQAFTLTSGGMPRATPAQVAHQIAVGVTLAEGGQTELRLNPEELGRVRLSLAGSEGGLTVTIAAERPETADLLRRHIDGLAREFEALGYADIDFRFEGETQHDRNHGSPGLPSSQEAEPMDDSPAPQSSAGLALRAGLDLKL